MKPANIWIVGFIVVLMAVGAIAVWHWDRWGTFQPVRLPNPNDGPHEETDPAFADPTQAVSDQGQELSAGSGVRSFPLLYRQTRQWGTSVGRPAGLAVDAQDRIYVAGEKSIQIFSISGASLGQWALKEPACCITVAGPNQVQPGSVWIGCAGRVEIRNPEGKISGGWPLPQPHSQPTSITFRATEVFVADFTTKCVYRFDERGKVLGQIGQLDRERGYPGLLLPSPFCDVAVDSAGLLWVANPGLWRLEGYHPSGRLERFWGESGSSAEGFFGCCNPAHFCLLPDGRFVTSEKGLLRIKVYSAEGTLEGWVARPDHWATWGKEQHWIERIQAADVAADSQARVIVLHLGTGQVHLFEPLQKPPDLPSTTPQANSPDGTTSL